MSRDIPVAILPDGRASDVPLVRRARRALAGEDAVGRAVRRATARPVLAGGPAEPVVVVSVVAARKSVASMLAEVLREAAVLVGVFGWLEKGTGEAVSRAGTWQLLAAVGVLFGAGVWLERRASRARALPTRAAEEELGGGSGVVQNAVDRVFEGVGR
jgi:hypothetical protein